MPTDEDPSVPRDGDPEEGTLSLGSAPTEAREGAPWHLGPSPSLAPGDRFGRHRLVRLLGRGGFGEVWEAEDPEEGRRVALKVLTGDRLSPEAGARFRREAEIAASLSHPHCVFVYAAEEMDDVPALAMELLPGGTLAELVEREGPLPWSRAVDAILDLISGLEAAHAKGILHRDLKPSNCFLTADGRVKVGDFGLSRPVEGGEDLTRTGTYLGTPAYSSPEQVRGRRLDARSDIYSLGATLYYLLTGAQPFGTGGPGEILARVVAEDPEPLATHGTEVPPGLERLLQRMMAKEPERRPPDYQALEAALMPYSRRALTPATLGLRLGAYVVDWALLAALATALVIAFGWQSTAILDTPPARVVWSMTALTALYFLLFETTLGWSPGKGLLGLRVRGATGEPIGLRQGASRTALFVALTTVPSNFTSMLPGSPGAQIASSHLLLAVGTLAVLSTMRRRNGWAGLHEIASSTRVLRSRESLRFVVPAPTVRDAEVQAGAPELGPFRLGETLWRRGEETLHAGWDPKLGRRVWVHQAPAGRLPPPGPAVGAEGWLRWLRGERGPEQDWDAWEAPEGEPLLARVAGSGALPWRQALLAAASLAAALRSWRDTSNAPELGIERLWLEPSGRVVILPFAAAGGSEGEHGSFSPRRWQALLHQTLLLTLEGRPPAPGELGPGRLPRRPLPAFLVPALSRVATAEFTESGEAAAQLRQLAGHAGGLRWRRAGGLALVTVFPILMLAGLVAAAAQSRPGPVRPGELEDRLGQWEALERKVPSSRVEARKAAVEKLLGDGAARRTIEQDSPSPEQARAVQSPAATPEDPPPSRAYQVGSRTGQILAAVLRPQGPEPGRTEAQEALLARLAATHGVLEPEELAAARALAGRNPSQRALLIAAPLLWMTLLACAGILLAFLFRGGLTLWLLRIAVQRRDGTRASRLRCALRASVAWSPVLVGALLLIAAGHLMPRPPESLTWWLLALGSWLALLLGALWALRRPERGIQDHLAGTWLVPR